MKDITGMNAFDLMAERMKHYTIHVATSTSKVPLTIRLRNNQQKVSVTRIAEFPGMAKYSVRYGESRFKYFEVYKQN